MEEEEIRMTFLCILISKWHRRRMNYRYCMSGW